MADINPISDPADILRQADAESAQRSAQSDSQDARSQDLDPQTIYDPSEAYANSLRTEPISPPTISAPSQSVYVQPVEKTVEAEDVTFTYRLPVTSYVLGWMYFLLSIFSAYSLWSAVTSLNAFNNLSSVYSSSGDKYTMAAWMTGAVFFAILLMLFTLMNNHRFARILSIVLSAGLIGYGIYLGYPMFKSLSSIGAYGFLVVMYIVSVLPYIVLPLISLVYMMTPRARFAYSK